MRPGKWRWQGAQDGVLLVLAIILLSSLVIVCVIGIGSMVLALLSIALEHFWFKVTAVCMLTACCLGAVIGGFQQR